jgi:hypothetical protein
MTLLLRDSQQIALEKLCEPGRTFAALWAEPRSGKTAVALRWIQYHAPRIAVVVGPKIAEGTWRTEAAKWLDMDYVFYPLTAGNDYPELKRFRKTAILFVNYEQFGKKPWKRLGPYMRHLAKLANGQGMMLLDESHMIKTPNSVTGKNIRPLAPHWKYRLLMTGTPVTNPNQIDAVYGQWTFLDPAIRNRWSSAGEFRDYFGEWTSVKGYPELVRPRRQYELNHYIQPHVITMVGPGQATPVRRVRYPIPAAVRTMHDKLRKEGVITVDGADVAALNPLTRLLRMRTLVAGWLKDDTERAFTVRAAAQARLGALTKVLSRCDGKVIICCTHLWEVKLVRRYLRRHGLGYRMITGDTKGKNDVIDDFQRDRDVRVLLVQPRTVSMAVDISVANDLIWYSSDFNYVTFKQTSDRIKLSPANPTVWFLCARDTVDEDVWITLQEDHDHLAETVRRIKRGK